MQFKNIIKSQRISCKINVNKIFEQNFNLKYKFGS